MTSMGPYNSPMALGVRPWGSLFWSIWAAILIPAAILNLVALIAPIYIDFALNVETVEAYAQRWQVYAIIFGSTLILTMVWSEFVGAGPFAGSMKLSPGWVLASIVGGPLILFIVIKLISLTVTGTGEGWAIRDDISADLMNPSHYGVLFTVLIVGIMPLLEEIAFRGIGLGCLLVRGWEPVFAIGLVAFIWALTHTEVSPLGLVPIFVAGVFFGWLRVRTGSMAAPIIAHMSANGIQFLL